MNISLCIHGVYMAKLYWRVKIEETGKWKWVAATNFNSKVRLGNCKPFNLEFEPEVEE